MIQYSRDGSDSPRGRGVLDSPLSRGMTAENGAPYSAGLASDDALADACEAAAFFSTIPTAMIEPS